MTFSFNDYEDSYLKDYSGGTPNRGFTKGGLALDAFRQSLKSNTPASPIHDYSRIPSAPFSAGAGGGGRAVGKVSQGSPAFQPAGPPQRYQVNLLGEAVGALAATAPGQAFLGTQGDQRGGSIPINFGLGPGVNVATAPVNFQNFATYAREAPLSVITSILGHNYQQPTGEDPYAKPAGPPNNQTIFENMSEADFGGMLDNIIDGVGAVGDAISAPFTAAVDWYRRSDAVNRGKGIRDLALTGAAPGNWINRITSIFDDTRFDWNKLAARAEEQGISQLDLAADLWDLKPEAVKAIFDNPNITDEQLQKVVEGEPFSYDPGVNVIVELSANLAPLVVGAGLVRGVGIGAKAVGNVAKVIGGVGAEVAGPARTAAAIERVAPTIARWQMISDAGLVGRPIATAEALGVRTLVRAWRTTKAVGLGLEKFNRYSLMAGTGIRLGEWTLKQAAVTMGYDDAVKTLDQWLWEMPLSNNPGLMLVDGFAVHPLRTAKSIGGAVKRGTTARLFGGGDLAVSPVAAKRLGSIADMPLDVVQERLLDRLGWDAAGVSRVFGEDGPLSNTDLKNGLLYFAQQVVRDRHEAALRYLEPEADMVTRSEAFWKAYGDEATKVLQSALTGRGKDADAIVEAVTKEFWERANLTDASELGNEGFIGPYDGNVALSSFAGWIRVSKLAQQVQDGAVVALRPDVNETFLAAFRDRLRTDYTENQTVSATDLNTLRQQVPSAFKARNGLLKRHGDRVPKVTRRQLEKVLDVLEAEQQLRNLEDARPPTQSVPALRPHEVESRMAIARAFHLRQDTVNKLMDTPPEELAGPVPGDLAKVLADTLGITERDSRTNPATSWARAATWWQNTYQSAVDRGVALDAVDHFAKIVEDRFQDRNVAAVDKAAFDAIRYALTHPYERFEKLGPTADAISAQRDLTLTAFTDRMSAWLEDPARQLRTEAAGTTAIVETPLFRAGDATMIEQLAAQAPATSRPEVLAILADPNAHPLEKVDALREAMSDEPMLGTKVQRMRVLELPSLEGAYEALVKDVIGEDALANRDTVTQLTSRVQAAEAEFASLRDEARSLGGIIDRSPTRHLTQEVRDFLDRASVLGGRKIGVGPQGAEAPTWRALPLDPAGVATVINDVAHQNAIAAAEGRVQQARSRLAEIEQRSRLAGVDPNLTEVRWEDAPLEKFPTKKAAKEAAQLAAADGRQYGVSKVGSRWGLFRGERVDRAAAPPEAAQSPAAAGTAQAVPAAEPTRVGTFVDAPEYGPGVERVPLDILRRFMEIDREATPKGGELSVDLDALAQDMVENGVHEPVTLEYDPLTHTAMLTDGNHRLAAAARAGMADLPVKVEIVKRTQTEIDAGQQVLPGFVPVDAEARPGAAQPFALRPSHLLKGRQEAAQPRTFEQIVGVAEPKFTPEEYLRDWNGMLEGYRQELNRSNTPPARKKFLMEQAIPRAVDDIVALERVIRDRQPAPQAPSAPEAPAVAPEAAPPEKLWQQGGYGVNTEASFFRPQEFDAISADAPPDAVRLQSGYEWEHVPVDRLDRIPDTNLREMASQILRVAKLADDEVPGFKPKVVKKPARPEHTYKGYGDEGPMTVAAQPAYYTFRIDDNNLADQNSLKMGEGDRSGKFPTQEAAKAAMLRWQEQRTAELRQRIAQAKHDAPYIEAELKRRGEGILDSKGNPIMYAGSMQDAGEGYPRLRREAATWSDEVLSQRLGQYSENARRVLEQEMERRASGADGLPPIVEQITEAQRVREAQVEQLARETATQLAAAEERAVQYQEGRVVPGGEGGELESALRALAPDDQMGYDALVERYGLEEVSAVENRLERGAPGGPGPEVTFLDPQDNKTPIRSRVVLVEADDLLTSDEPGFPPTLQPRSRGVRASSAEQVQEYAADIQPDKLIGTTEGSQGMPVVSPDGAVVAGNGRTMALRLASTAQYGRYRTRIQAEALKHGFTVEDVNAMRRPMLVRELVDVDPATMERLAWQLNEMPVGDLAPSVAAALTRSDIREFKVGDDQSLADAIRSPANTGAVARMIGRLPRDWHARFFDPKTGLNEPGARLLEAALISKLLRADDRGAPGFEAARAVVFQIAEQGAEDIRRIGNGLAEGTAQVVKAYELAESGAITPDILTFGSDLAPALARIIELRDTGLNMEGVRNALDNTTMFEAMTLTPQQTHLAKLLASSETQREVRTFMRAVAKAAEDGPVAGQEAMFADVPQVDYTGLLNEGVKAWNETRKAAGKSEIDYFPSTEAPYDIPLTTKAVTENAIGQTQGPARMTQPLAPEEVDAEVASRTIGESPFVSRGDSLDSLIDDAAEADFETFAADVRDLADTFHALGRSHEGFGFAQEQIDAFDLLLESANAGEISPAEAFILTAMGGGLRRNAAGKLNMRLTSDRSVEVMLEGLQRRFKPTAEQAARKAELQAKYGTPEEIDAQQQQRLIRARVIRPDTQKPLTAEELAADVGPDVPYDVPVAAVDEAIAAGEHIVVVGDNPTVNRAVRRAVGAPAIEDNKRRVIEVNAPDGKAAAEILEAARLEASAALQRAEAEAQAMRDGPPPERQVASVFPDAKLRDMWDRLMRGSDVDELAAAVGSTEPTSLAEVMDAIQSIDRGVYGDPNTGVGLTPDEAMVLRSHLMRLANGTLENAITRKGVRQTARATAKLGKPPDDFDAAELQDRAAQLMDEAGSFVQVDPNAPPLEGFMGAQYVLAKPPTKEKGTNRALPPRLLFTDRFAGDVVPGLLEELEVGRMENVPRRIGNARVARLLDTALGPRPEQQIRAKAIGNFKEEIARYVDEDLNRDAAKKMDDVVEGAYAKWRDHMEKVKPVGGFQLYRRIHLIGPETLDKLFMEAVTDVYGTERPAWLDAMTADGKRPSQLWRRADNRMRRWLSESGLPLSDAIERLYGKVADTGEPGARIATVIYHFGRFLMDVRWLALEAVEPLMLTLPRGGIGPVLEASVARKSKTLLRATDKAGLTRSTSEPLAFGVDARQLAFREFAHWANVQDIEQGTAVRHRYLVRELMREQQRPFKDVLTQMMRDEPQLRRLVEESDGGDANAFLRRLDRDWQLAERGTKRFQTNAQAAEFFKRWLDDGVIDQQTYNEFVDAKSYTAHPAIEAELAKVVNDPFATALFERLAAINQDLFHSLTATFFGQENRSNLQRLANHPLLFWPISYQIKATKWLMRMMLEEFGGVDTGATVAGTFQHVHDEHRQRFATDPRYRANYTSNKTLYFLAGMLLPIIPTEVGVSMSPWTRMMLYPEYERANGIFGVGPIYTNLSLIPRLIAEQQKPGGLLAGAPPEANDALQRAFPQTITVGGSRKKPTSEINAEQQRLLPPSPEPIPPAPLTTVREP